MIVFALLLIGVLVLAAVLAWTLRRLVFNEAETEKELERPGTYALAYDVPLGQDPVVVLSALHRAGYTAVSRRSGGKERVVVECHREERAKVREIIEGTHTSSVSGGEMTVPPVRFEDEAEA